MVCQQSSQKVRKYFTKMGPKRGKWFRGNRDGYFWGLFYKYGAEGFPNDVPQRGKWFRGNRNSYFSGMF